MKIANHIRHRYVQNYTTRSSDVLWQIDRNGSIYHNCYCFLDSFGLLGYENKVIRDTWIKTGSYGASYCPIS